MAQKDFSEKKLENVTKQGKEWAKEFVKSPNFQTLTESAQKNAETIIVSFSESMYKEESRVARQWTATSLETILTHVFPKAVAEYQSISMDIVPVLTTYFDFLDEEKKIGNAATLNRKLQTIMVGKDKLDKQSTNKKITKKTQKKQNKQVPYTQDEINRFNRFTMGASTEKVEPVYSVPAQHASKVGRNDLCPCGSGKKYKKCHGK